ncbi:hypothetical protein B0H14DRAFT_2647234 [Mycena olivaceomarginata]|nr:hypothetical protein B0H14DRAFT_2647234 [Mycena olivaceomarginata]
MSDNESVDLAPLLTTSALRASPVRCLRFSHPRSPLFLFLSHLRAQEKAPSFQPHPFWMHCRPLGSPPRKALGGLPPSQFEIDEDTAIVSRPLEHSGYPSGHHGCPRASRTLRERGCLQGVATSRFLKPTRSRLALGASPPRVKAGAKGPSKDASTMLLI